VEVKIGGQWIGLSVSAVLKDAPQNSSIRFSALARTEIDPSYAELKMNGTASTIVYMCNGPPTQHRHR